MDPAHNGSPNKVEVESHVDELFKNMKLNGNAIDTRSNEPKQRMNPPPRAGTLPPPQNHRPSRSQEQQDGRVDARPSRPRPPRDERGPFESLERRENRRPRRNSESSIIDKGSLTAEEERRRRERRRERERERGDRGKDGKSRDTRSQRTKKPHGLDTIDKLDATGLYGVGLFHHDGPFDACNPHRNRKKDHRAPMQAFPMGSANMAMGGSGPVNNKIDIDRIHGRQPDAFGDYNARTTGQDPFTFRAKLPQSERSAIVNPKGLIEPVHGEETAGLGTSTFLEGAPASRSAMQRRDSENETAVLQSNGLSRKKSLAQRIRGISQPRRGGFADGAPRIGTGEPRYNNGVNSPEEAMPSRTVQSAGGITKAGEQNPFFEDYDDAYEKKGTTIRIAEDAKTGRPRAPSSPMRNGLERRLTSDSGDGEVKQSGGFLGRMKSLNRGKKRPERPDRPAPERPTA
ncbi:Pal1-domain-containing protein [Pseudovirgaria hyperparasitica]|uniref:Pal1-domain-containing protein n=1 Tax=Pseudovirgaria hyperparasitica TaxID=470096 RepID=A0A6A6W7Z9_9PEZI|nr:Pal1-domain-containing protein [Pseudovirgaria hyperparasitica]KAF2758080.1 Pal1-domain-containing protein [Pseudovirgaria hyperparasitica]